MVLRENYNGVVMLNSFIQRRLSNFPATAIKSNRSARHVSSLLPRKFTPVFHIDRYVHRCLSRPELFP